MGDTEIAKVQLREHLSSLLIPRLAEGFWSIQENANQLCERNKQPAEVLRTFQNMLTKIPDWSDATLAEEVERILKVSKCAYMDDLLMGVFLSYMKSFAALHYRGTSSQVKVEFERPNVTKFIHEFYKQSARKLWQSAYLFKTTGVSTEQQAKNRREIEELIYKTLDDIVRFFLPWEIIAKSYFTEPPVEEKPAPPPASKSVIFEDITDSESEEEESKPSLQMSETVEVDIPFTDLNIKEQPEEPKPEVKEVDPLDEIDSRVGDDTLVLNL
jgi:hypothetical protein